MSVLLRSLLVASVTGLLLVGCGEKAADPVEAPAPVSNPAVEAPAPVEPAAEATSGPGGYEPTAEERVPGITLDAAAVDAAATTEAAPAAQ
ncbi:MAG: hypothetical protein PSV17_13140 [Methylotenera sp.]|uniref:hypothetical protein n=1 Tax=Methylotenera sp. TaxID=2051956 RepID=UPI0024876647|nr:hypothetical protein [Methylotenera sp.]MDI1310357.1 hypothetical protein [Methylotenera sp.]